MVRSGYWAAIGGDMIAAEVTFACQSAAQATLAARAHTNDGEVIVIYGPRGGTSRWEAIDRAGNRTVRRLAGARA